MATISFLFGRDVETHHRLDRGRKTRMQMPFTSLAEIVEERKAEKRLFGELGEFTFSGSHVIFFLQFLFLFFLVLIWFKGNVWLPLQNNCWININSFVSPHNWKDSAMLKMLKDRFKSKTWSLWEAPSQNLPLHFRTYCLTQTFRSHSSDSSCPCIIPRLRPCLQSQCTFQTDAPGL